MLRILSLLCCGFIGFSSSQNKLPHAQAHAHNDYEHAKPLWDALEKGFISVEADVHLVNGNLLVSHNTPKDNAPTLQQLYLNPLDSLLSRNSDKIYPDYDGSFYLMIDCKTEAEPTYAAIQKVMAGYKKLLCHSNRCPVKIFISGNRALNTMIKEGYQGIALDGRPGDLGQGISSEWMPVVSDRYSNWSAWNGKSEVQNKDLVRIHQLADRVHAEGKKLRLWAIPDHEKAWQVLLDAGVDFINTDRLSELDQFLNKNGR
jgi:hypothetical protein